MKYEELTGKIIELFYRVYDKFGFGFLEKVYENALAVEFEEEGLEFKKQSPIRILYKSKVVGEYFADFIVEDKVIVELKADSFLGEDGEKQLLNYLRATDKEVGLLLNFGKRPEIRRKIFEMARGK